MKLHTDGVTFSYLLLQTRLRGPFPLWASVMEEVVAAGRVCPVTLYILNVTHIMLKGLA